MSRVFVDTSVWVDYLRGALGNAEPLGALLVDDDVAMAIPVRIELLTGVSNESASRLRRLLGAVPTYRGTEATWSQAEEWALFGARQGERFGVADLFIAALAKEQEAPLWSFDHDFVRMAKLGFLNLYSPP